MEARNVLHTQEVRVRVPARPPIFSISWDFEASKKLLICVQNPLTFCFFGSFGHGLPHQTLADPAYQQLLL